MAKRPELGKMLVEDGLINQQQLEEAVHNQVIFGGRLGTNLLEFGYLDEATLAHYLAKQHRVKTVRLSDLARVPAQVIKIIPKKLAAKLQAVPIRLEGNKLYVVMSDPSAMGAISEISFVTGKVVVPLVLPEVRVFDLLHQYYGLGRELKYINIAMLEAERRAKALTPIAKISPVKRRSGPTPADQIKDALKEKIIAGAGQELTSEKEFEEMNSGFYLKKDISAATGSEAKQIPEEPKEPARGDRLPPLTPTPVAQPVAPTAPMPRASSPQAGAQRPAMPPKPSAPQPPSTVEPRDQPYKQVARAIYQVLINAGVNKKNSDARLKNFLKSYVMSELRDFALPLKTLYGFLIGEAGETKGTVDRILEDIVNLERPLLVRMIVPGTERPELKVGMEETLVQQQAPEAKKELIELEEELVELEPLPEQPEVTYLPEPEQVAEEPVEEVEPEIPQQAFADATRDLMEKTQNRDDLARAVLGFAKGFFQRSILFTVSDDRIFGWYGTGQGIKVKEVQQLLIPLKEPSVFKTVVDCSCHYLGPMGTQPVNQKFLESIGGAKPNSVFLIPIIWQQKVVYVLYGDNGDGQNVPFDIGELLILAQKLPRAIERLIEEKKKQYQVIQGGKI